MNKIKQQLTRKNIFNGLWIALLLVIVFVPGAKAMMIRGLIEIGLFNPAIETECITAHADLTTIKFKDSRGKVISLADLKGKIIFLNFWATWCPPCLAEMPSINKFYEQFREDGDVVFIMVDADGDFLKSQAYMDRKKYKMPVYTFASDLPEKIFKGSLPTTIVFDKKGRISFQGEGAANYASSKFINFIKQLKKID